MGDTFNFFATTGDTRSDGPLLVPESTLVRFCCFVGFTDDFPALDVDPGLSLDRACMNAIKRVRKSRFYAGEGVGLVR